MSLESNDDMVKRLMKDIEKGEGQEIEFIEDLPSNIHEIAKEIAAFASINPGTIYLGVSDKKRITGVSSIRKHGKKEGKDSILNRLGGITQKAIKPPIRVVIDFIDYEKDTLVRISVPKGVEPVYYSSDIPYIRILTTSQRATPDQVKELHRQYFLGQGIFEQVNETSNFLTNVLFQLSDFQILWSDHKNRCSSPDMDQLKYDIGDTGRTLIKLSIDPRAHELGLSNDLQELGDLLEEMEHHKFYIDGGRSLKDFWNNGDRALELVDSLLQRVLGECHLQENYIDLAKKAIIKNINELEHCWRKKDQYWRNRGLSILQDILRRLAHNFNRYGYLLSEYEDQSIKQLLKEIAINLRELSSQRYFASYVGTDPIEMIRDRMDKIMDISRAIQAKIS